MYKCPKCGGEFSRTVLPLHIKRCKAKEEIEEIKEVNYEEFTVKELEIMCKERGITGYSDMKKAELIEVLKEA